MRHPSRDVLDPHDALIYVMVMMSGVDRAMADEEIHRIGDMVRTLPVFRDFDVKQLVPVAEDCARRLSETDGFEKILTVIAASLPDRLGETAYLLACEIAAGDLNLRQEELRLLGMLRGRLRLGKLVSAAIERAVRARYQTL
jgi:tellurite resistance protein